MRKVWSELTLEEESTDQPPSPCTQKEHDQKDLIAAVQVRPPKKGKIILQPQSTVGELLGAREAVQWVSSQKKTSSHDVPDKIYQTMSKILDEVRQMVCSFPMHEVKKSDLDTCVRELAAAAFPDPSQHSLQSHYVRAANGLLRQILKDNDKVIEEETVPGKELLIPVGDLGGGDHHTEPDNEEIDRDADMFPLF